MYYYNARYYDPGVGRFVSEDPAKDGVNWYVYCTNNPLIYVDKDGLEIKLSKSFKMNENLMEAYEIWKKVSEEKYIEIDKKTRDLNILVDNSAIDVATASRTRTMDIITISARGTEEYSIAKLVSVLEHEMTHQLEKDLRRSLEYEYRAWSAEFNLMEKVYEESNPWKYDKIYEYWRTHSKDEFKIYLRDKVGYNDYTWD